MSHNVASAYLTGLLSEFVVFHTSLVERILCLFQLSLKATPFRSFVSMIGLNVS
jgi:hypothetical protein